MDYDSTVQVSVERYNAGELPMAITAWDTFINSHPPDARAFFARGALRVLIPEMQEGAVDDFSSALQNAPDDYSLAIGAGAKCEQAGLTDVAIKFYGLAVAAAPDVQAVYHYRGLAYSNAGFSILAIEDFTAAIELSSADGFAHLRRAVENSQLGNMSEAFRDLGNATKHKASFQNQPELLKLHEQTHVAFAIQFVGQNVDSALDAIEVVLDSMDDEHAIPVFKLLTDNVNHERSRSVALRILRNRHRYTSETQGVIATLGDEAGFADAG